MASSRTRLGREYEFPAEHLRHKPFVGNHRANALAHLIAATMSGRQSFDNAMYLPMW